jgi:DinB superfamily
MRTRTSVKRPCTAGIAYNLLHTPMSSPQQQSAPAWPIRLAFELSGNDQTAHAIADGLSESQLNWHLTAASWSIGQCLEHMAITNEVYLEAMATSLESTPDSPVEQITPGAFSRWFIRNCVEPSPNSKRFPAPSKIKPAAQVGLGVLDRFLCSNKSCREFIVRLRNKDVNRIRFWNPLVPGIRFTVGAGLEIISSHNRRHLLQAERIRDAADFPK